MGQTASGRKRWAAGRGAQALLALAVLAGLAALPASGAQAASAGLKPSEAPLVAVGQHYFGNTYHVSNDAENGPVDLWGLPPLLTSDAVTIAWNASAGIPELCLAQNIDDFSWAEGSNFCNGSGKYRVSGSGSARTVIQAKNATSAVYLEFWGNYCCSLSQPYDFTIESIQHAIGVGLTPVTAIRPTSTLTGSANLSNGSPVPDGLAFTLSASWVTPVNKASHSRRYTAASLGGALAFPLNLPASAQGKHVSLVVTRAADPQYLAASSAAIEARVAKLAPPRKHHHRRHRHHRHRLAYVSAQASGLQQKCVAKLLQPPHDITAAMVNPHKTEIFIKAFYGDVEGCDSWERLGKFRVQLKQRGQWRDLNGNFWYPTDSDKGGNNEAHGFCFLDFDTHDGVREEREHGHWQPARVRFINFVSSAKTDKVVAHGEIKNQPVKIEPSTAC